MNTRILIADDNSNNIYMLESLLKGYGYDVISAQNGEDALSKARYDPPDIIITDILMPVMDGYALCREWKSDENLKNIPVIFYTATYREPKDESFALKLGVDRFIVKPQEPEVLINIIKEVLAKNYKAKQVTLKPLGEEMELFRQYNEILFSKLEKKMIDLEKINKDLIVSEERYRLSFENVSDVISISDTNLKFLSVSPSIYKILGYKPEELIGNTVSDFKNIFTDKIYERVMTDISKVLNGEIIPEKIYRLTAKDGSLKFCEVNISAVMREDKLIGVISITRDITERKKAEEELLEKNVELERFSYTVSHDLKSPLVTIKTFLGYLEKDLIEKDAERITKDMDYVNNAAEKMSELINELLEFSRIGRCGNPPVLAHFNDIVKEAINITAGDASNKKIQIKINDSKISFYADCFRLVELWQNLIDNAIKFSDKNEKSVVEIGADVDGRNTTFYVRDNGIGIDNKFLSKIFVMFEIHDAARRGTGMGLAIAKRIVDLYEGKIRAESEGIGKGTTICFTLPKAVKL